MAKKLLETSFGSCGRVCLSINGEKVSEDSPLKLITDQCDPYVMRDNGGVIVYLSSEEYNQLKKDSNYKLKE